MIGGKHLSKRADFTAMVRGATPDVVLTAVELLAQGLDAEHPGAGDVVVVDVGGATTDVHSVVEVDPEDAGLAREVVATLPVSRTVEGDLGMRWSAVPTVEEGVAAGLLEDTERLRDAAARTAGRPGVPARTTDEEREDDEAVAAAAVGVALRRHAGRRQVVSAPTAGSSSAAARTCARWTCWWAPAGCCATTPPTWRHGLGSVTGDHVEGGWQLPRRPAGGRRPRLRAGRRPGLLAAEHPRGGVRPAGRLRRLGDGRGPA